MNQFVQIMEVLPQQKDYWMLMIWWANGLAQGYNPNPKISNITLF